MRIWIDDIRKAPDDYVWCKSVNEAKSIITAFDALKEGDYRCFENEMNWARC